jgi:hypothetical protein
LPGDPITLIVGALATLMIGTIGAVLGAALTSRAKIDEGLRDSRLKVYPQLWEHTATASRWPRNTLSITQLSEFHNALRDWYYKSGGLFLSERARELYGNLQELNDWMLQSREHEGTTPITEAEYAGLREVCSSLRTALTLDLQTRKTRPILSIWQRREDKHWYERALATNKEAIERAETEARTRKEKLEQDRTQSTQIQADPLPSGNDARK